MALSGVSVGGGSAREYWERENYLFSYRAAFGKLAVLRANSFWRAVPGTGKCAEFRENGCKFILISLVCTRIGKNYTGGSKVRK
jgi:hypothetical protein